MTGVAAQRQMRGLSGLRWPGTYSGWGALTACLVLPLAMLAALTVGRYPLPPQALLRLIGAVCGLLPMDPAERDTLLNVVVQIRLPRVMAAALVGAALSASGAAYQAVFRNPLVSPGLLGVLAGAAFGAALGILLAWPWWAVQALAFGTGVLAVVVALGVAGLFGEGGLVMLVLGGILSSALLSSLLACVKYVADPYNQLPAIVYWLMGSLAVADLSQLAWMGGPMLLALGLTCLLGRGLDALAMGDDEAHSLGLPVRRVRLSVIGAATLMSALTVSLAGMIGWVGLIVPHIARLLVGPAHARLLPFSAVLGALFLVGADALSRSWTTTEVPIGIVTELLGIPVFLLVLGRVRKGWA